MAELTWIRVAQTTDALAEHLLESSASFASNDFSPSCEQAVDEWVNRFADNAFPEFYLPRDPQEREALLARLQHAGQLARENHEQGVPAPARLTQGELFRFLLVEQWHRYVAQSHRQACAV